MLYAAALCLLIADPLADPPGVTTTHQTGPLILGTKPFTATLVPVDPPAVAAKPAPVAPPCPACAQATQTATVAVVVPTRHISRVEHRFERRTDRRIVRAVVCR